MVQVTVIIYRFDSDAGPKRELFWFRAVPALLPNKGDWEINPYEFNFSSFTCIGKALPPAFYSLGDGMNDEGKASTIWGTLAKWCPVCLFIFDTYFNRLRS
jgi:hypothetical protein